MVILKNLVNKKIFQNIFFQAFFLLFLVWLLPAVSFAFVFRESIHERDDNPGVKNLQIVLNQNKETQIAETGAGSPGQETSFFGVKTKAALIRFQKNNNLLAERGFVGAKTRLALNKKLAEFVLGSSSASTKSSQESLNLAEFSRRFVLKLPSGVKSRGTSFPVVASSSVGSVAKSGLTTSLEPKIISISPTSGSYGTVITIKGENFSTSSDNTIYTGYSILKNRSSYDGKTMTFVVEAFSDVYQQSRSLTSHFSSFSTPLFIYVENSQGKSNGLYFNYVF